MSDESDTESIFNCRQTFLVYSVSGTDKGIQFYRNSCYIESLLMSLFYVTRTFDKNVLLREVHNEFAHVIQNDLRKIVHKIRTPPYRCPHMFVSQMRLKLAEIEPNILGDLMDVGHFLTVLLGPGVLHCNPFFKYKTGQGFYHQIILSRDRKLRSEDKNVETLVNASMEYLGLKLRSIETAFLIKMPLFNGKLQGTEYIVPNLSLHLSNCMETESDYPELELLGVICFQSSHYTTYLRYINQNCATQWFYYDSLGPTVKVIPELEKSILMAEENPAKISNMADTCREFRHLIKNIFLCIYAVKSDIQYLNEHALIKLTPRTLRKTKVLLMGSSCIGKRHNQSQSPSLESSEKTFHDNIKCLKAMPETLYTSFQKNSKNISKTVRSAGTTIPTKILPTPTTELKAVVRVQNKQISGGGMKPDKNELEQVPGRKETESSNSGLQTLLYAMLAHTNIFDNHLFTRNHSDQHFEDDGFDDVSIRSMLQAIANNLRSSASKCDFQIFENQIKYLRLQLDCRVNGHDSDLGIAEAIRLLFHVSLQTCPFIRGQEDFVYVLRTTKAFGYDSTQNILAESMEKSKTKFLEVPRPALIICRESATDNSCYHVVPSISINLDSSAMSNGNKVLAILAVLCKRQDGGHFVYVRKFNKQTANWMKFDPSSSSTDSYSEVTKVTTVVSLEQDLKMLNHPAVSLQHKSDLKFVLENACAYIYYPEEDYVPRRTAYSTAV